MKEFFLSEMLLLSQIERAAKRTVFDRKMTVILGSNDTGKSVLLKSIYWTLGAEPAQIHPRWTRAEPTSLLRFFVDDEGYQLLRRGGFFALYTSDGELLETFTSVSNGLGPRLAAMLNFRLTLPDRNGKSVTPPPAFLFLPFYVDQDSSWSGNWKSFSKLGQFPRWRKPTIEYHTGVRDNEYYALSAELHSARLHLEEVSGRANALQRLIREFRDDAAAVGFNTSLEAFQSEVTELLIEANHLAEIQETLKVKLEEQYTRRSVLNAQISIVKRAADELSADFDFATHQVFDDSVECPTCGAEYENGFAERFSIAEDEDRITEFLADLISQLAETNEEILTLGSSFSDQREQVQRIQRILHARQGEVTLDTVIQARGRGELREAMRQRMTEAFGGVVESESNQAAIRKRLATNEKQSRERKATILGTYTNLMMRYTQDLNVRTLADRVYTNPDSQVPETGSDLPRALMAYYYSVLHIMRQHSPSAFCPIVIDSPNQQGQDLQNLVSLLEFIRDRKPSGAQLILGVEDLRGVEFEGTMLRLSNTLKLLNENEYESVAAEITPLLRDSLKLES